MLNITNALHELKLKRLFNEESQQLSYGDDIINCDLIDNEIVFDFQISKGKNYAKPDGLQLTKEASSNSTYVPNLFTPSFLKQKIDFNVKTIKPFNCLFAKDNNKSNISNCNKIKIEKQPKNKIFSLRTQIQKDRLNTSKSKKLYNSLEKSYSNNTNNLCSPNIKKNRILKKNASSLQLKGKDNHGNNNIWCDVVRNGFLDNNQSKYWGKEKRHNSQENCMPNLFGSNYPFDYSNNHKQDKITKRSLFSIKIAQKKGILKLMQILIKKESTQTQRIKQNIFYILIHFYYSSMIHNVLFSYCNRYILPFKKYFLLQIKKKKHNGIEICDNEKEGIEDLIELLLKYLKYKKKDLIQGLVIILCKNIFK